MSGMGDWKHWVAEAFYAWCALMGYLAWERLKKIEKTTDRIEKKLDEIETNIDALKRLG